MVEFKNGRDNVTIRISAETAERMNPQVANIEVVNSDGSISTFFICVGINRRNQPVCEVSTNRFTSSPAPRSSYKTVTANLKDAVSRD